MAWLSGFTKRVEITIPNTNIDAALSHFPVPLTLGTSVGTGTDDVSFVFDELTSYAKRFKIAVTEDDGETQLYVEIEKWDNASESAVLWVSGSGWSIASDATTTVYLYFDSDADDNVAYVADLGNRPEVWDSNFVSVHHMTSGGTEDLTIQGTALWLANKRAVRFGTNTYFIFLDYTNSDIEIAYYNHSSGLWSSPVKIADAPAKDAHVTPSLCIDSSGYIYAFFGDFTSADDKIRMYKSTSVEDISAWDTVVDVVTGIDGSSYVHPIILSNDDIVLFYRSYTSGTTYGVSMIKCSDGGATWANNQVIFQGSATSDRAYHDLAVDANDRIHLAYNYYDSSAGVFRNIYYAYTDNPMDATAAWKEADGGAVSLPMCEDTGILAFDSSSWDSCYIAGIAVDSSNVPYIIAKVTDSVATNKLICLKYSGGWGTSTVVESDAIGTPGSTDPPVDGDIFVDANGYINVLITIEVSGEDELQEYQSTNSATSFSKLRDMTTGSTDSVMSVCYPLNPLDSCRAIYFRTPTDAYNAQNTLYYWGGADRKPQQAGTSLVDSTSNRYTGTQTSDDNTSGLAGDCQNFDGSEKVTLDSHVAAISSLGAGTIEAFGKAADAGATRVFVAASCKGDASSDASFFLNTSGYLRMQIRDDGSYDLSAGKNTEFDDGAWHQFVFAVDGDGNLFYVDGAVISSPDYITGSASTAAFYDDVTGLDTWRIGVNEDSGGDQWFMDGDIDEVRISSSKRGAAWIKATNLAVRDSLISWGSEVTIHDAAASISSAASISALQSAIMKGTCSVSSSPSFSAVAAALLDGEVSISASASLSAAATKLMIGEAAMSVVASLAAQGILASEVLDIGAAATNRGSYWAYGYTAIDLNNPANESGNITSIEIYASSGYALSGTNKIATFSRDGAKFTPRDVVIIGSVAAGSKQTITTDVNSDPISLSVESGDYIGIYFSAGQIERSVSGFDGIYYLSGDQTAAGEQTYTLISGDAISLYATGEVDSSILATCSISIGSSLSIGAMLEAAGVAVISAATSLSLDAAAELSGSSTITSTPSMVALAHRIQQAITPISSSSSLSIAGNGVFDGAVSINSVATMIAMWVEAILAECSISSSASMSLTPEAIYAAVAAITSGPSVSASGAATFSGSSSIASSASLSSEAIAVMIAEAAVNIVSSMSALAVRVRLGEVSISATSSASMAALLYVAFELGYTGTLAAGDVLEIDTNAQTVKLNGSNATRYFTGDFWELLTGTNQIRWAGDDVAPTVELKVEHEPRWL